MLCKHFNKNSCQKRNLEYMFFPFIVFCLICVYVPITTSIALTAMNRMLCKHFFIEFSGFPPYLENLEFCHFLFQSLEKLEICKFYFSSFTFQDVIYKNNSDLLLCHIYIINTNTDLKPNLPWISLLLPGNYLENTWNFVSQEKWEPCMF